MNPRKSLYDVKSFYKKKAVLKASFQGMRYQVEQNVKEEESCLRATVWAEPFCFEKTSDTEKESREFAYSEEGLDDVYEWLCQKYEEEKPRWEHARDFPYENLV